MRTSLAGRWAWREWKAKPAASRHRNTTPVLEGPKLYKRHGYYYIFAPIGGVEKGPQAVGRARDIKGPYEWRVVLEPGATAVQGPHQGGYVETPSGEGWFVHFNSTGGFGRIVHLQQRPRGVIETLEARGKFGEAVRLLVRVDHEMHRPGFMPGGGCRRGGGKRRRSDQSER